MNHSSRRPDRFEALDALRGLCALLVVLFHIPVQHALKGLPAFAHLQVSVDLFFALSGFVLYHAYGHRLTGRAETLRFLGRRVLRLWPLHAVVLAAFVGLELAKFAVQRQGGFAMEAPPFAPGHAPGEIATNLLFLQAFGLHPGLSWNGPAWSAAVEFHVSLLFAGLVLAFPRRHLAAFLALAVAAGLGLLLVSPETLYVSTDWGVLRAGLGFFSGCLVRALRAPGRDRLPAATLWEAACLAALATLVALDPAGPAQMLFLPPILATIHVFSFGAGRVSRLLGAAWLQALGLWSYSIYMVHAFVFQLLKTGATVVERRTGLDLIVWQGEEKLVALGSPETGLAAALVLSVVLVVPLAALTHRLIERPAMEVRFRPLRPRPVAQPAGLA